jgi:hypothetical protein
MAFRTTVTKRTPPRESSLADWYTGANLIDSYEVALPPAYTVDMRVIAQSVFGKPTLWFRALLFIRDIVMARFNVKTSSDLRQSGNEDKINFFSVLASHSDEIIMGANDTHLDFRLSLLVQRAVDGPSRLSATSVVHCHNRLGQIYIMVIAPFHRMVVISNLRRAATNGFRLRTHSQNMTVAARQTAEKKTVGHLS